MRDEHQSSEPWFASDFRLRNPLLSRRPVSSTRTLLDSQSTDRKVHSIQLHEAKNDYLHIPSMMLRARNVLHITFDRKRK
jgi:hypothetical protein